MVRELLDLKLLSHRSKGGKGLGDTLEELYIVDRISQYIEEDNTPLISCFLLTEPLTMTL
jgi:hypothetical protein